MHARKFEHFLEHLDTLTRRQRDLLLALLQPAAKLGQTTRLIEQAMAGRLACPTCS